MHTIDLLRGEGIPPKTTLSGAIAAVVVVLVPFCVAAAMLDRYMSNRTVIEIQTYALSREQSRIDSYSGAVEAKSGLENRKADIEKTLAEVAAFTDRHIQWSPILLTLAENVPENMVITALEAACKNTTVIVHRTDPDTDVKLTVPKRSLVINLAGKQSQDHDREVIDFRDRLAKASDLGSKLQDVVISRESDNAAEQGNTSYRAVCVFEQKR